MGYGNGIFVASAWAYPARILTSTNGLDWAVHVSSGQLFAPELSHIAYGNRLFVGVGNGELDASTNGLDWANIDELGGVLAFSGVAYGAGTFSALFGGGNVRNLSPLVSLSWNGQSGGVASLTLTGDWLGMEGRLQASPNLSTTNWTDLFNFTNSGPAMPLQDAGATNYARRFYRLAIP